MRTVKLASSQEATVTFLVTWHMPNLKMDNLPSGRFYATRFDSAASVATYLAAALRPTQPRNGSVARHVVRFHLPYWFLDRTFLNTSILATSTCHRFGNGRFWGWEGVGCCHGTCGHVWQYAHAWPGCSPSSSESPASGRLRLRPQPDGAIHFRGEFNNYPGGRRRRPVRSSVPSANTRCRPTPPF